MVEFFVRFNAAEALEPVTAHAVELARKTPGYSTDGLSHMVRCGLTPGTCGAILELLELLRGWDGLEYWLDGDALVDPEEVVCRIREEMDLGEPGHPAGATRATLCPILRAS